MNGLKVILGLLACVLFASAFEKEANGDNYIVGGRAANRNQFPWMASVRTMQNQHFCGGFILSDRWVGSAAHCTQGNLANPHNVLIATGAHTRYDGNRHRVNRIMLHPRFNRQYLTNDVCIIQTADRIPITLRGPIRAIRFPDGPNIQNGSVAFIAGWGITEVSNIDNENDHEQHVELIRSDVQHPRAPGQGIPQVLQWKPTMIITRQECQERYGVQRTQLIHADTVCTSNPDGKGTTNGIMIYLIH